MTQIKLSEMLNELILSNGSVINNGKINLSYNDYGNRSWINSCREIIKIFPDVSLSERITSHRIALVKELNDNPYEVVSLSKLTAVTSGTFVSYNFRPDVVFNFVSLGNDIFLSLEGIYDLAKFTKLKLKDEAQGFLVFEADGKEVRLPTNPLAKRVVNKKILKVFKNSGYKVTHESVELRISYLDVYLKWIQTKDNWKLDELTNAGSKMLLNPYHKGIVSKYYINKSPSISDSQLSNERKDKLQKGAQEKVSSKANWGPIILSDPLADVVPKDLSLINSIDKDIFISVSEACKTLSAEDKLSLVDEILNVKSVPKSKDGIVYYPKCSESNVFVKLDETRDKGEIFGRILDFVSKERDPNYEYEVAFENYKSNVLVDESEWLLMLSKL